MTTPTPDQPRPDAAEMTTARPEDVLADFFDDSYGTRESFLTYARAAIAALREDGYVIVERDDLEMAVEWMDQSDNPWGGSETFADTWAAALVAHLALKDALAESYAARQGEDQPHD